MWLTSLIIVTNSTNAYSEEAVVILQGKPAPYSGLLLPEDKAIQLYNDINKYKLLTESYQKSVDIYKLNEEVLNKKINLLNEQNDKLSDSLLKARSFNNWEKAIWFGLGFLSVSMGIYGVKEITK